MKHNKIILSIVLIIAICIIPGCKKKEEASAKETSKYPVYLLTSDDFGYGKSKITAEENFHVVSKTNRYIDENAINKRIADKIAEMEAASNVSTSGGEGM